MNEKDKRVKLMSEIIKGIRVIKYHVWEKYFINKVSCKLLLFIIIVMNVYICYKALFFRLSRTGSKILKKKKIFGCFMCLFLGSNPSNNINIDFFYLYFSWRSINSCKS